MVKQLKHMSSPFSMEEAKKLLFEKQPELTSLLLTLAKDTKKEELVRLLREHGKMLGLVHGRIMFLRLLLLLSRIGLELEMVILVLLLGMTIDYVKEILAGNSHNDATSAAMRGFIKAFKERANKGATLYDEACHKASRAFFDAVPHKSDPIIGAGFTAFSDKLFAGNGMVYDPVCLEAMEAFIDSHAAGDDLLTSNMKAARSFFKAFVSNPQSVPADRLESDF